MDSSQPQSACLEPADFCTGLGLPGFCNHVQHVQLSALPRPKIWGGHEVDAKGYKPQKKKKVVHVSTICRLFLESDSQLPWHS